jgi:hypothetical protein
MDYRELDVRDLGKFVNRSTGEASGAFSLSLSPVDQSPQSLKDSGKTVYRVQDHDPIFIIRKVKVWVCKLGAI